MTWALSSVHELMVVRVQDGQLVEGCVLHCHRVLRRRAGRAVVPREEDGGPAVVKAKAENELIAQRPGHQGFHLWLANILLLDRAKLGRSQIGPVWESTVEVTIVRIVPSLQHEAIRVEGG